MKLYFFGSSECENCQLLKELIQYITKKLRKYGITEIQYIDSLQDDQQDFCDQHNVNVIPHVKVFDDENLIFDKEGLFDIEELFDALKK